MNCTFCVVDCTPDCSSKDTLTCGDPRPGFLRHCRGEGLGAPTPRRMTVEDCSFDVTSPVAAGGVAGVQLQQLPIGCKDRVEGQVDGFR